MTARQPPNLPPGFVSSETILDGNVPSGSLTKHDSETALSFNLFAAKEDMPEVRCGDVIVVLQAKVMVHRGFGAPSLCSNRATKIHIYKGDDIPKPPKDASIALRPSHCSRWSSTPAQAETQFVSSFYHSISKDRLPDALESEKRVEESRIVRDKKRELKDARDGSFCDIVAELVRDPFLEGDRLTLWVSDYTKNDRFFNVAYDATRAMAGQAGDPHGYLSRFSHLEKRPNYKGPYGQLSMQVTCWGPHAHVVQDHGLKAGDWVLLLNVRIKIGNNMTNLEGCIREDAKYKDRLRLVPLHVEKDLVQLKDALVRKRAYLKAIKQERVVLEAAVAAGKRRKAENGAGPESGATKKKRLNAKARRQEKRDKQFGREEGAALRPPVDLNVQVKCENALATTCSFAKILAPVFRQLEIGGEPISMALPFLNVKFINDVKVSDFAPSDLREFARPVKAKVDVDAVSSDDDQSSLSSSSSQDEPDSKEGSASNTVYEWRFLLELEDATVPDGQEKKRCWVLVDNEAAQCLTNLNATNLHRDSEQLQALREQLFILWGNLEERKAAMLKARDLDEPPAHSDDEAQAEETKAAPPTSRPFRCCIRQFGVKVKEPDVEKANAGRKKRWERLFGLFGTRIAAP